MRRVIVTRPAEQSSDLAAELAVLGIEALSAPMLTVEPVDMSPVDVSSGLPEGMQALLVTSANGAEALPRLTDRRDPTVFAVGLATAEAARKVGFNDVRTADGDGEALVDRVARDCAPDQGPLVWVSGEAISTDLAALLGALGYAVERHVAYRTVEAQGLPTDVDEALRAGSVDAVLFFSPRSAKAFATLVAGLALEASCAKVAAHCMSRTIAEAASTVPWREIHVAGAPTKPALLATLADSGTVATLERR